MPVDEKDIGKRIGDISDIPEELKRLLVRKEDELEERIITTIKNRYEGVANVDEIIVGLFRDFGYITKDRRILVGKLYRMIKLGYIESVPKRKGVFKIKEAPM